MAWPVNRRDIEGYESRSALRLWCEGLPVEALTLGRRVFGRPPIRFCIFAQGRTGSTLLTSSLNSHPAIRCRDEILRRPRLASMTFLDNASRGVGQAFGFHLKPIHVTRLQGQPDPHLFLNDLTRQGWRLIHLQRRDLVAQVFSVIYAAHAGRYHFTNDRRDEDRPLAIKPKRFVRKLRAWNDMRELEQRAIRGLDAIDLSYEGDLVDPVRRDKALARIVASLGLPPAPMSSSLRKSVRRPVWEMIANADEVRDAMVAAGFDPETGRRLNPEPDLAPQMFRR